MTMPAVARIYLALLTSARYGKSHTFHAAGHDNDYIHTKGWWHLRLPLKKCRDWNHIIILVGEPMVAIDTIGILHFCNGISLTTINDALAFRLKAFTQMQTAAQSLDSKAM